MMADLLPEPIDQPNAKMRRRQLAAGLCHRLTLVLYAPEDRSISHRLLSRWAEETAVPVRFLPLTSVKGGAADLLDRLAALLDDGHDRSHGIDGVAEGTCEERLIDVINGLVDQPAGLALVLMDTAAITSTEVSACLERLVDYLPPQIHLYLAGTTMPPLTNLARLRVRRQLLEIDWRDPAHPGDQVSRHGGG